VRQAFVDARAGVTVLDVPAPTRAPGQLLVRTAYSVISAGTETTATRSAGSVLQRAIARPDLVRQVARRAIERGIGDAASAVQARLAQLTPLGYSSAGTVLEADAESDLRPGQMVACAGAAYAHHAEVVVVPRNLAAPVPDGLDPRAAAFATIGAIALQGVRRAGAEIGEVVGVVGLGLVGQLAAELLTAQGCRVLGFDTRGERIALAREAGAIVEGAAPGPEADALVQRHTERHGLDAVLLVAATPSSDPVNWAFAACRERGRVVVVGEVGLDLAREPFYRGELDLLISRSYGPGRYDPTYEELGIDYPYGRVRWTENRNMAAFLDLALRGRVRVERLITNEFGLDEARAAYAVVEGGTGLGVLFRYGAEADEATTSARAQPRLSLRAPPGGRGRVRLGLIGPGHFTQTVHLPNLRRMRDVRVRAVVSRNGGRARRVGESVGAEYCATDYAEALRDPELDAVLIGTRHDLHAAISRQALEAGKHVFVEKPLGLSNEECAEVVDAVERSGRLLAVGFNRRLAPLALRLKAWLGGRAGPMILHYHVEAGALPADHWLLDPAEGGGRILGEAVHFFDFLTWLVGAEPVALSAGAPDDPLNELTSQLRFADGSVATLLYSGRGDTALGKERIEGARGGAAFILDDFAELRLAEKARSTRERTRSDKGHAALLANFVAAVAGRERLAVSAADGASATALAVAAIRAARDGTVVDLGQPARRG
jgi:predicted dehydrogenase/threonine dehydrogenase-like Zn-dependent dehydrogenase